VGCSGWAVGSWTIHAHSLNYVKFLPGNANAAYELAELHRDAGELDALKQEGKEDLFA
jgi:hypothetical protein